MHELTPEHLVGGGVTGLAATVTYIFWRYVLPHFRRVEVPVGDQVSGARSVDFWKMEMREAMAETLQTQILPLLQQQNRILEALIETNRKLSENLAAIRTLVEIMERRG